METTIKYKIDNLVSQILKEKLGSYFDTKFEIIRQLIKDGDLESMEDVKEAEQHIAMCLAGKSSILADFLNNHVIGKCFKVKYPTYTPLEESIEYIHCKKLPSNDTLHCTLLNVSSVRIHIDGNFIQTTINKQSLFSYDKLIKEINPTDPNTSFKENVTQISKEDFDEMVSYLTDNTKYIIKMI